MLVVYMSCPHAHIPEKLNSMNSKVASKAREARALCGFPQPLLPQAHRQIRFSGFSGFSIGVTGVCSFFSPSSVACMGELNQQLLQTKGKNACGIHHRVCEHLEID